MAGEPDLKRGRRIIDKPLLARLHREWTHCVICGSSGWGVIGGLSLHHLLNKPRDDVEANLVMLCGSGTTGCHGRVEDHDHETCARLAVYLVCHRLDSMAYLGEQLGGVVAVREWLLRRLYAAV